MEEMIFYPHKKLFTKSILALSTWTFLILLIALFLQIVIPLDGQKSSAEVANTLWPITIGIVAALWIISVPLISVWFKNLKYAITSERITIHKGIISRNEQNIPFKAITDFSYHRSPYDRLLGIGSLRIQTAGQSPTSSGFEGIFAGLTNGPELLEELRQRVKENQLKVSVTGESKPQTEEETLTRILEELKKIRTILESK
jgi:uncharacterized membrane protein YdbT with pleckstrin-like domain